MAKLLKKLALIQETVELADKNIASNHEETRESKVWGLGQNFFLEIFLFVFSKKFFFSSFSKIFYTQIY